MRRPHVAITSELCSLSQGNRSELSAIEQFVRIVGQDVCRRLPTLIRETARQVEAAACAIVQNTAFVSLPPP